jgi:protein SCO1/2
VGEAVLDRRCCVLLLASALAAPGEALGHQSHAGGERLPAIGPAADFALTRETGAPFTRRDLDGKVAVVTFIYTSCGDVCPLLTQKLVGIQDQLGERFGQDVFFVSITLDPEVDRPDVLRSYAQAMGCDPAGWAHLTGTTEEIAKVAHGYGVVSAKRPDGEVVHNLLTSISDRGGTLRVQYLGTAFDPDEFEHDLRDLMAEAVPP